MRARQLWRSWRVISNFHTACIVKDKSSQRGRIDERQECNMRYCSTYAQTKGKPEARVMTARGAIILSAAELRVSDTGPISSHWCDKSKENDSTNRSSGEDAHENYFLVLSFGAWCKCGICSGTAYSERIGSSQYTAALCKSFKFGENRQKA